MGRTNPTYRDRLAAIEREWQAYRRGLRVADQQRFDALFDYGREYAHAAGHLNHTTPERSLLVSMLLAHERRLEEFDRRLDDLDRRLDDLDRRLKRVDGEGIEQRPDGDGTEQHRDGGGGDAVRD